MVFDYIAGGADDEQTLRENNAAFKRIHLLPRVLVGVSERQLASAAAASMTAFIKSRCSDGGLGSSD
jgi:isopentenyl diphosphate isomerase/L-lactate dehydrogenase-like FMN-dependent dehydrogenase